MGAVEDREVPGPAGAPPVPVRVYYPDPERWPGPRPTVVFCHGGGWVLGDLDGYDATARALCRASGAVLVSVDHRRAPEARFPASTRAWTPPRTPGPTGAMPRGTSWPRRTCAGSGSSTRAPAATAATRRPPRSSRTRGGCRPRTWWSPAAIRCGTRGRRTTTGCSAPGSVLPWTPAPECSTGSSRRPESSPRPVRPWRVWVKSSIQRIRTGRLPVKPGVTQDNFPDLLLSGRASHAYPVPT